MTRRTAQPFSLIEILSRCTRDPFWRNGTQSLFPIVVEAFTHLGTNCNMHLASTRKTEPLTRGRIAERALAHT